MTVLIHASRRCQGQLFGSREKRLTVRGNDAAVGLGALDGAAKAQGVSIAGGQRVHHVAVDGNVLGVVSGRVLVLVCSRRARCCQTRHVFVDN